MCEIRFGNGPDYLKLQVLGRVKPDAQDYWDANWLRCIAEASAGTFHGRIDWQLRNEDLVRFLHRLERLDSRAGEALLDTGDGWLDVRVIRDQLGHIEARCQLVDNPAGGNTLEFRLRLDEAAHAAIISQLRKVIERFPVVGREGG
jgi:hypothetical protein